MRNLYLALAIAGAVVPWVFFLQFIGAEGTDPGAFVGALFVNGATAGFTSDLLISSAVFWLWLVAERAPRVWLYVLVNLTVGLSCALPLFLYLREARARGGVAMA